MAIRQAYIAGVYDESIALAGGYIARKAYDYWASPISIPKHIRSRTNGSGRHGVELKFIDYERNATTTALVAGWDTFDPIGSNTLSSIPQGLGESERIGRVFWIKSIHLRGFIFQTQEENKSTPRPQTFARISMIWDKQTNGTQLLASEVMNVGKLDDIFAFRNLNFANRFKVLWTKSMTFKEDGLSEGTPNFFSKSRIQIGFEYHKICNPPIKVINKDINGTIGDITDNSLHIIAIAETDEPLLRLSYQFRMRFVD